MKIAIELAAGQLRLTGDAVLQDKIASLGMLEMAKSMLLNQAAPQPTGGIEVPTGPLKDRLLAPPPANGTHHGG